MTDPLSRDELHALIDAKHRNEGWDITTAQADRLLDIAEDHARLHEELRDSSISDLRFRIRELNDENAELRERVERLERVRRAVIHCERFYGQDDVNWQIELNAALAAPDADLARELEELLPCSGSSPQCDAHDPARCTPCRERPAILAWTQRKLDEALRKLVELES